MNGLLRIRVEFLDGRPGVDDEIPADYPPSKEQEACMQLLAAINNSGGLVHFEADGLQFFPIGTIKSIKITAPAVVIASGGGLIH
jgi:hypothetical protein